MLKYVLLKTSSGDRLAVFGLAPLTHRQIAEAIQINTLGDAKPVSAGFVSFRPGNGLCVHPGQSESLRLGPAPGDEAYLNAAYSASLSLNEITATMPY